jgi:hypothetical protein
VLSCVTHFGAEPWNERQRDDPGAEPWNEIEVGGAGASFESLSSRLIMALLFWSFVVGVRLGALNEARNLTSTNSDTTKQHEKSQQKIHKRATIKEGIKTLHRA